MIDIADLMHWLRKNARATFGSYEKEAADALDAQAKRIAELETALRRISIGKFSSNPTESSQEIACAALKSQEGE